LQEGRNIKKIMQDTQTKIHVSNQVQSESLESNLWDPHNTERVITIRGSIEGMSNAESLISSKLKVSPAEGGGDGELFSIRPDRMNGSYGYVPPGYYPFPIPHFGANPYQMTHPFYHPSTRTFKNRSNQH